MLYQPTSMTPGISYPTGGGGGGYGGGYGYQSNSNQLLGMLQQLVQRKLANRSFGTNGYQVPQGSYQLGTIRADGSYVPGN